MHLKVAMWGVGLLILSIFGFFLINIFGNITVTNQQNYTIMKNAVQAAMYDALDIARYRTGFCVCSVNGKNINDKWIFNNSKEYKITDIVDGKCNLNGATCKMVSGEYKINSGVFAESLIRRFAENVTGSKRYQIVVNDVIEYPPKVKVTINSYDTNLNSDEEFTIVNEIDAILESEIKK